MEEKREDSFQRFAPQRANGGPLLPSAVCEGRSIPNIRVLSFENTYFSNTCDDLHCYHARGFKKNTGSGLRWAHSAFYEDLPCYFLTAQHRKENPCFLDAKNHRFDLEPSLGVALPSNFD
jgi:hypothetical protein